MTNQSPYTKFLEQRWSDTRAVTGRTQRATARLLKWRGAMEDTQASADAALGKVYEAAQPLMHDVVPTPAEAAAAASEALRRLRPLRLYQTSLEQFSDQAKRQFYALRTRATIGMGTISDSPDPHSERGGLYEFLHQQHVQTHQPQSLAQINPEAGHFADLGEQTARTVVHGAEAHESAIHESLHGPDTEHNESSSQFGEPTRFTLDRVERDVLRDHAATLHGDTAHELSSLEKYALTCSLKASVGELSVVALARTIDIDEMERALQRVVDAPSSVEAINQIADSPLRAEHEYRQRLAKDAPQGSAEGTGWEHVAHLDQICSEVNAAIETNPQIAEAQQMRARSFPVGAGNDQMRQTSSAPHANERANVRAQGSPLKFDLGY